MYYIKSYKNYNGNIPVENNTWVYKNNFYDYDSMFYFYDNNNNNLFCTRDSSNSDDIYSSLYINSNLFNFDGISWMTFN